MNQLLHVSSSPHVHGNGSTGRIMLDVLLALVPATLFGIYRFGMEAAVLIAACMATAVLAEWLFQKAMKKKSTVGDLSALVTGLLLALNLPSGLPVWMACLGSLFAIVVVKQLFGGLGQNFMNPALAARCFLLISFTGRMTDFGTVDGVSSATPLMQLKSGGIVNIWDMFLGTGIGGTIGEVSAVAILMGAAYLLIRKVISIRIPAAYLGSFAIFILIYRLFGGYGLDWAFLAAHLCGGGLMLGAFFMATDYVTSPITKTGKLIFGIVLGILTALFRLLGGSAEGVSYAIILGNLLVPLIEKVTLPRAFGKEGRIRG